MESRGDDALNCSVDMPYDPLDRRGSATVLVLHAWGRQLFCCSRNLAYGVEEWLLGTPTLWPTRGFAQWGVGPISNTLD